MKSRRSSERLRGRGSRTSRGFTLTETLVVIFILAVLAMIFGAEVPRTLRRQKLAAGSNDIRQMLQRTLLEMQRRGIATFAQVGPKRVVGTSTFIPVRVVADTNGNGVSDPDVGGTPDTVLAEYDIPLLTGVTDIQELSLSTANKDQVQSTLWSNNSILNTAARSLRCDFLGRAIDPTTGRQIAGVSTLVLTHRNMVDGTLGPLTRFVFRVNPLWNVSVVKEIWQGGAWVQES